jgi:uncharacterized protein DUF1707
MSQTHTGTAAPVRASDAERDQTAEILRAGYAEGRLSRAELDERIAAAYAAKTRADLRDLTTDLPGAVPAEATVYGRPPAAELPVVDPAPRASMHPSLCLLFCFPPAGIAYGIYWILTARRRPQPTVPERSLLPGAGTAR